MHPGKSQTDSSGNVGLLGDMNELMILSALAGTEMALCDSGIDVTLGSGVGAAAGFLRGSL